MSKRIKKNDVVLVLTGRDKGKQGKVLRVLDDKIYVDGMAMVCKTVKASQENRGGIFKKEAWIHASNLKVLDSTLDNSLKNSDSAADSN